MSEMKESLGRQTHLQPEPVPTQNVGKTPAGFNEHGIKTLGFLFRIRIKLLDVKLLLGENCSFNVQTFSNTMSRRALLWPKLLGSFFFAPGTIICPWKQCRHATGIRSHAEWAQLPWLPLAIVGSSSLLSQPTNSLHDLSHTVSSQWVRGKMRITFP